MCLYTILCCVHCPRIFSTRHQTMQCIEVSPILCPFSTQSIHSYVMKCHLNSLSMLMPGLSLDVSATKGGHYKCQTKSKAAKSPFVQFKTHSVSQRRVRAQEDHLLNYSLSAAVICRTQLCKSAVNNSADFEATV